MACLDWFVAEHTVAVAAKMTGTTSLEQSAVTVGVTGENDTAAKSS